MATNKKPPIYAHCKAGSLYQVPHISEVEEIAAFVEVSFDQTEPTTVAEIEPYRKYRIYGEELSHDTTKLGVSVTVKVGTLGEIIVEAVNKPVSYSNKDNFDFEFLGFDCVYQSTTAAGWYARMAWIINGELHTNSWLWSTSTKPQIDADTEITIEVCGATRVLLVNDNATVKNSVVTVKTIDGKDISFFWGTSAEYELLTEEQTQGLFALITDEAKIHQHNITLSFADNTTLVFSFLSKTALPCEDYEALAKLLETARYQIQVGGIGDTPINVLTTGMLSATGFFASGGVVYGFEQQEASTPYIAVHYIKDGAIYSTAYTEAPTEITDNVIEL